MAVVTTTTRLVSFGTAALFLAVAAYQEQNTTLTPALASTTLAALPLAAPAVADNPASPAKDDLGRALF